MDPILQMMIRYGIDPTVASLALAASRMAQVLVYGEEAAPAPQRPDNGLVPVPEPVRVE